MSRKSGVRLYPTATPFLPERRSLRALAAAAEHCRGCPLYRDATQVVFGEGRARAALMLVGEQPGDREDVTGRPFVGPAGALLDRTLAESGIDRGTVYLTNAVKHFKFVRRGERRLHAKPGTTEVAACRPWLIEELQAVRPRVVVALGATAARSLIGKPVTIGRVRGEPLAGPTGERVLVTTHPSALLRIPDRADRRIELGRFAADLELARKLAGPVAR